MIKSIIFDLYGTLVTQGDVDIYHGFFNSLGLSRDDIFKWLNKSMTQEYDSFHDIIKELKINTNIDIDKYQNLLDDDVRGVCVFSDTYTVLDRLSKKYNLYLLSNAGTPYKQPYFDLDLDKYFKKPFFSCECGMRKPDIEFYNMVVDYGGLNKNEIIMIGDSYKSDFLGAQNAGIKSILRDNSLTYITREL